MHHNHTYFVNLSINFVCVKKDAFSFYKKSDTCRTLIPGPIIPLKNFPEYWADLFSTFTTNMSNGKLPAEILNMIWKDRGHLGIDPMLPGPPVSYVTMSSMVKTVALNDWPLLNYKIVVTVRRDDQWIQAPLSQRDAARLLFTKVREEMEVKYPNMSLNFIGQANWGLEYLPFELTVPHYYWNETFGNWFASFVAQQYVEICNANMDEMVLNGDRPNAPCFYLKEDTNSQMFFMHQTTCRGPKSKMVQEWFTRSMLSHSDDDEE